MRAPSSLANQFLEGQSNELGAAEAEFLRLPVDFSQLGIVDLERDEVPLLLALRQRRPPRPAPAL
jgi:hypothetical protein